MLLCMPLNDIPPLFKDSTDSSGGFLVLNGTDATSTNAGSQFDLETATLKDVIANAI